MIALIRRAKEGGSFTVDVCAQSEPLIIIAFSWDLQLALNYYSRWLTDCVGTYPHDVWQDLWIRNNKRVFRHFHNMTFTFPKVAHTLMTKSATELFRPNFFAEYNTIMPNGKESGKKIKAVAPVLRFPSGEVEPGFNIGTRTNGVDEPVWPDDLSTQVVG
jgi:hypothetical protein